MKSIIITGANSGIGFECALQMARIAPEHQIILACRNMQAAISAMEKIKAKTAHSHLLCLPLDLTRLQSIEQFKSTFSAMPEPVITALINNAGIQNIGKTAYTEDGFELTFGTNHLGPFYLTLSLLPFMEQGGSITFTSSDTHDPCKKAGIAPPVYTSARTLAFPVQSTQENERQAGERSYSTSKLCNVLTTYMLSEKLKSRQIRVNAFDPGLTPGTGLAKTYPAALKFIWNYIMPVMTHFRKNTNSPATSGVRLAQLAMSAEMQHLNGIYYSDGRVSPSSKDSYNKVYQAELWKSSMELIGLPVK